MKHEVETKTKEEEEEQDSRDDSSPTDNSFMQNPSVPEEMLTARTQRGSGANLMSARTRVNPGTATASEQNIIWCYSETGGKMSNSLHQSTLFTSEKTSAVTKIEEQNQIISLQLE